MATMEFMFEQALTTTDQLLFVMESPYLWTLEVVSDASSTEITIYQAVRGQTLGTNLKWLLLPAGITLVPFQKVVQDQIFSPPDRDIRAYASADCIVRGYGARL